MHGTLRFLFLSHLLYGICVKIFIMNGYLSKSYTTSKNTVDRQHTERGGICGKKNSNFFLYLFLAKIRLKTESSVFHTYSKPRNKHHRLEGLLRFKKPIISRKLYIVFQSWLLSSRLKLCEPARFSNVSITCPKICCDVGRKMKMFVYKPKENCA